MLGFSPLGAAAIASTGSALTGVYSVALTTQTNVVAVGGVRATKGGGISTLNDGEWYWSANVLYYRSLAGNPDTVPLRIEAAQRQNLTFAARVATVQDITFQHSNSTSQAVNMTSITGAIMRRCTVKDGAGIGIQIQGSASGNTISYVTVSGHQLTGIEIDVEGANLISHCTIFDNGLDTASNNSGVGFQLGGTTVEFCRIYHNGSGGTTSQCHGIYVGTASGVSAVALLNDNIIYTHTKGNGIRLHGSATCTRNVCYSNTYAGILLIAHATGDNNNYTLIRNTCYGNTTNGIGVGTPAAGTYTITLYHNTTYGNGGHEIFVETGLAGTFIMDVRNNIAFASAGKNAYNILTIPGTVTAWDYNLGWRADASATIYRWGANTRTFANWQSLDGLDAHGRNADPLFTEAATGDFSLAVGSPAINTGLALSGVNDGFSGPSPDLGVFEWISSAEGVWRALVWRLGVWRNGVWRGMGPASASTSSEGEDQNRWKRPREVQP